MTRGTTTTSSTRGCDAIAAIELAVVERDAAVAAEGVGAEVQDPHAALLHDHARAQLRMRVEVPSGGVRIHSASGTVKPVFGRC